MMNLLPIRPRRRPSEEGYILVAVIFMLALLIIALAVGVPDVRKSIERDREVETMHRGKQFIRAIKLYYKKFGSYPTTVDALVKTNNMRFLRKKYIDPTTGKDEWRPIHMGQTKAPTALGFFGVPMAGSTLGGLLNCGVNGLNTSSPGNSSGSGSNSSIGSSNSSFGSSTSSFGSSTSSFGSSTSSFGSSTSGFGSNSSIGGAGCPTDTSGSSNDASGTSGNSNGSSNTPGNPNDPSAAGGNANNASANGGNSNDSSGSASSSNSNSASGSSDSGSSSRLGGQTFGGGGIIGFAPGSARQSILVYKKKNHFNQWEFVYDPIVDQMQAIGGAGMAQPTGTTGLNGSPGFSGTGLGGTSGLGGNGLGGTSGLGGTTSGGNSGLGSTSSSDNNSSGTDSGNNPPPPPPPQ